MALLLRNSIEAGVEKGNQMTSEDLQKFRISSAPGGGGGEWGSQQEGLQIDCRKLQSEGWKEKERQGGSED